MIIWCHLVTIIKIGHSVQVYPSVRLLARPASRSPVDGHFLEKIVLLFMLPYKFLI